MGVMKNHGIIVSSYSEAIAKAAIKAQEIGLLITNTVDARIGYMASFLVVPDGSKEGWPDSNMFDEMREAFKRYLKEQKIDWVEVVFGCDDGETYISESS